MARFYQTTETPIVDDAISKVPFNELASIIQMKDKNYYDTQNQAITIANDLKIDPYYKDSDTANQIAQEVQQNIDDLVNKINSDKLNASKYLPEIQALKNQLAHRTQVGDIAKINRFGKEMKEKEKSIIEAYKNDKDNKLSHIPLEVALNNLRESYQGFDKTEVAPDLKILGRENLNDLIDKTIKESTGFERKDLKVSENGINITTRGGTVKGFTLPVLEAKLVESITGNKPLYETFKQEALMLYGDEKLADALVKQYVEKNGYKNKYLEAQTETIEKDELSTQGREAIAEKEKYNTSGEFKINSLIFNNLSQFKVVSKDGVIDETKSFGNLHTYYYSVANSYNNATEEFYKTHPDLSRDKSVEEQLNIIFRGESQERINQERKRLNDLKVQSNLAVTLKKELTNHINKGKKFMDWTGSSTQNVVETTVNKNFFETVAEEKAEQKRVETQFPNLQIDVAQLNTQGLTKDGKPILFLTSENYKNYNVGKQYADKGPFEKVINLQYNTSGSITTVPTYVVFLGKDRKGITGQELAKYIPIKGIESTKTTINEQDNNPVQQEENSINRLDSTSSSENINKTITKEEEKDVFEIVSNSTNFRLSEATSGLAISTVLKAGNKEIIVSINPNPETGIGYVPSEKAQKNLGSSIEKLQIRKLFKQQGVTIQESSTGVKTNIRLFPQDPKDATQVTVGNVTYTVTQSPNLTLLTDGATPLRKEIAEQIIYQAFSRK
jgi:hypothetical protein